MRVAVVGCGIGRAHIRSFQNLPDQFTVAAVCDLDTAKAQAVATQYGIERVSASLDDVCAMRDVDVIDLCTPSHLHTRQIMQALNAGKNIICEKPLAGSLKDVDEIIAAERASGLRIMPIFQKRFGNGLQKLRFLQREGLTGRAYLSTVETHWRRRPAYYATWHGKWQTELGGPLVTLAIHAHDMFYHVLGPAHTVFANLATLVNPIETEDTAAISLRMADGSLAALSVTTGSCAEITRLRFCFANLTAESNLGINSNQNEPWQFTGDTPELTERINETLARYVPQRESFDAQFLAFHEAVRQGTAFPVTLADARASVEMLTAIYHSAQAGQAVTLPIGASHPKYAGWLPSA